MSGDWVCSVKLCKEDRGYVTSSLVRSNFKFTRGGKPVCVRCWENLKQQVLTTLEETEPYDRDGYGSGSEGW